MGIKKKTKENNWFGVERRLKVIFEDDLKNGKGHKLRTGILIDVSQVDFKNTVREIAQS